MEGAKPGGEAEVRIVERFRLEGDLKDHPRSVRGFPSPSAKAAAEITALPSNDFCSARRVTWEIPISFFFNYYFLHET